MTTSPRNLTPQRHATLVLVAFAAVYVFWGMTYMALHWTLQSFPPYLVSGVRFIAAGLILLVLVRLFQPRDYHWGSVREWRDAALVGTLLFLGGNGSLAWAQQYISTSTAALLFGAIPLFVILFDWLRPGGVRPTGRSGLGLFMGFGGLCVLLVKPAPARPDLHLEIAGELAVLGAACSWAVGALYGRAVHATGSTLLPMGRQMFCGGVALTVVSIVHGDWAHFSFAAVTVASWLGMAYLVIFGSLIGFTAYAWLMRVSTPDRVSTVTYVNTVIAVLLGWAVGEPMSLRTVVGAVIVIASVIIVLRKKDVRDTVDATPTEA